MEETLHIAIEKSLECLEHSVKTEEKLDALEMRVSSLEADASSVHECVEDLSCFAAELRGFSKGLWRSARTIFAFLSLGGAVLNVMNILLQ